ncbi:2354_t:CDS:2 [Acaulospora morrowiae]|uniref:Regulatory protein SIR2 homolog 7 n=1 Tax=Acaulospora morrowiae TaxID=94023 RepID=A0A9N9FGF0_9GLOM|nr:2354_t:CDS:2 [Acaulospora morrowiae]
MSSSVILPDDIREYHDPPEQVQEKIEQLMELIRNSKHMVIFTGAGVSTSAGIQDFRGYLTLAKQGIKSTLSDFTKIRPTIEHVAIYKLFEAGYLKHLISQNTDGFHLRSGIPITSISELHGNINIEKCPKCERSYWRKHDVRDYEIEVKGTHERIRHTTSRQCVYCHCNLRDTVVNCFDRTEGPHLFPLETAQDHLKLCDLYIILGSSLTVYPANYFSKYINCQQKPVVIVNLQKTSADDIASIRIFTEIKDVLIRLCEGFQLNINSGITDLETDLNFKEMIIMPYAIRKLDCIKEKTEYLKKKSETELMMFLTERRIAYEPPADAKIRKDHLVATVIRHCRKTVYWV